MERALWLQVGSDKSKQQDYRRMTMAVTLTLAENPSPAASQCLVRAAVFSESSNVRLAAADALKRRPLDQYVPLLLSGLQLPLNTDVQFVQSWDGDVITRFSIFQEGELFIYSTTFSTLHLRSNLHLSPAAITSTEKFEDISQNIVNANRAMSDAAGREAAIRNAVAKTNRAIADAMSESRLCCVRRPDLTWATSQRHGGTGGTRT